MRAGAIVIGLITFATLGAVAAAAPNGVLFVSRGNGEGGAVPGNKTNNDQASIDSKGQRIAFRSDANNISSKDNDLYSNIFLRDAREGTTTLISVATDGDPAGDLSRNPAISASGRYVAFESVADNLTINDSMGTYDIFVRDTKEKTLTLASLRTGPPAGAEDPVTSQSDSFEPSISSGGRLVAFRSREALDPADTNSLDDIYVRDTQGNVTILVSRANGPTGAVADGASSDPSISPNGRYVAFTSKSSTNLGSGLPADAPNNSQVYLRDLTTGSTTLVSRASGAQGAVGDGQSERPSVSNAGKVAFASRSENFSTAGNDALSNVFVRDIAAQTTTLVSAPVVGGGAGFAAVSTTPAISRDGKWVAFESDADNLSSKDDNVVGNVFIRDLAAKKTKLVSRAPGANGAAAEGLSAEPSISSTGKYVAFTSNAPNLSKRDNNKAFSNVFRRQIR